MHKKEHHVIASVIALILILVILNINTLSYLFSLSFDNARMMIHSEPLQNVLANNEASAPVLSQLADIPTAMQFGDTLGFPRTKAYSRYYSLNRNFAYYVLTASPKDSFDEYYWTLPLTGTLPYKTFVDKDAGVREQNAFIDSGYDTYLRTADATSSLGIYPDPIVNTMINASDPTTLLYDIYHERTHQLFFRQDDVTFDETSAVLIGMLSTREFIAHQYGTNSAQYGLAQKRIDDALLFSDFIDSFHSDLAALYASDLSPAQKISKREAIFSHYHEKFNTLRPHLSVWFTTFGDKEFNNALVLSYYTYYGKLRRYAQVYPRLGGDLPRTIAFFKQAAQESAPPDVTLNSILAS